MLGWVLAAGKKERKKDEEEEEEEARASVGSFPQPSLLFATVSMAVADK
jgi:hypothetical protein